MVIRAREVLGESLVDAAESGDSAFSFGRFSVSRRHRPFSESHASEQLSLASDSLEGPTKSLLKIIRLLWCTVGAKLRELKKEFTSAGAMLARTVPTTGLTANGSDMPFSFDA